MPIGIFRSSVRTSFPYCGLYAHAISYFSRWMTSALADFSGISTLMKNIQILIRTVKGFEYKNFSSYTSSSFLDMQLPIYKTEKNEYSVLREQKIYLLNKCAITKFKSWKLLIFYIECTLYVYSIYQSIHMVLIRIM